MVRGFPDYWRSQLPAKTIFSEGQASWYNYDQATVVGGSYADLCSYTVPAGYLLNIGFFAASCSGPGIQKGVLSVNGVLGFPMYYDGSYLFSMPESGLIVLGAGDTVAGRLYNLDTVEHTFTACVSGILQSQV